VEHRAAQPATGADESVRRAAPVFVWKSFSRFVEVYPVHTGWLVLWGRYERQGAVRKLAGQRVYADPGGVRGRLAAAVEDLTGDRALVAEAVTLFDRAALPEHRGTLPAPLGV
jgi:hypothetical protein